MANPAMIQIQQEMTTGVISLGPSQVWPRNGGVKLASGSRSR